MELCTNRLVLREYTLNDLELLHRFRIDKAISKYIHWSNTTFDGTREMLDEGLEDQKEVNRKYYHLVVCLKEERIPIGEVSINIRVNNDYGGIGILGYFLLKDYWHKGYMDEAVRKILEYGFETLRLHKVEAYADFNNKRSIKLLKRIGMKKEAHFKKELFVNNKWEDIVYYALQKSNSCNTNK